MKPSQPYQPFLLRVLHGLNGVLVVGAIVTAFWTYNTYDGRWGRLPLPNLPSIEGIHGTFGLWAILLFPAFALYAFHPGQRRLIQSDSLAKLSQVGQPIWWYTLHRLANTLMILALTLAMGSGKMMDENWLPDGELNHTWYYVHLIGWVGVVISLSLHLLMSAKVGGASLLLSMWHWKFRAKDSPTLWPGQIKTWWRQQRDRFNRGAKS